MMISVYFSSHLKVVKVSTGIAYWFGHLDSAMWEKHSSTAAETRVKSPAPTLWVWQT